MVPSGDTTKKHCASSVFRWTAKLLEDGSHHGFADPRVIAFTGHGGAQRMQPRQRSWSTTAMSSVCSMASNGQAVTQRPHPMQVVSSMTATRKNPWGMLFFLSSCEKDIPVLFGWWINDSAQTSWCAAKESSSAATAGSPATTSAIPVSGRQRRLGVSFGHAFAHPAARHRAFGVGTSPVSIRHCVISFMCICTLIAYTHRMLLSTVGAWNHGKNSDTANPTRMTRTMRLNQVSSKRRPRRMPARRPRMVPPSMTSRIQRTSKV